MAVQFLEFIRMTKLSKESRLSLIRDALEGLSERETDRIIREARGKIKKAPDPAGLDPVAHLTWQIEQAIDRNIHKLYRLTEEEFEKFLAPLLEKAKELPSVKAPALPCLLVFPAASLHGRTRAQKRRLLFQTLRFKGKRFRIKWSLETLTEDRVEVPERPYLATHVEIGEELACMSKEDPDDEDPAVLELASVRRDPLTLDEGLILSSVFEREVKHLAGLRLPGTIHRGDENCPLLDYEGEGGEPELDDMEASDVGDPGSDWYKTPYAVPSCLLRIGF